MTPKKYILKRSDLRPLIKKEVLDILNEKKVQEMRVYEAVRVPDDDIFYCDHFKKNLDKGKCGSICKFYESRNNKGGICKFSKAAYQSAGKVTISIHQKTKGYYLTPEEKRDIMYLFWNLSNNTDADIGNLLDIPPLVVGRHIVKVLDEKEKIRNSK